MGETRTEAPGTIPPETRRALTALIVGGVAAVLDTTIVSIALHTLPGRRVPAAGQVAAAPAPAGQSPAVTTRS